MTGAVLWDLDGTLVDSAEQHWRAWVETMAAERASITREQFQATFGQRNDSFVPAWLGSRATPADVVRVSDAKEARYRELVRENGLTPLPGAAAWLQRLAARGWKQAVASSAPRPNVDAMIAALGLEAWFQTIVAAEDVRRGKPDPEVFLTAAARLGVEPARAIVVEDAAAGIAAGRRAGMRTIGISHNGASLGADLETPSLAALPQDAFDRLLALRP